MSRLSGLLEDGYPGPHKRRKGAGLNGRYDRMITAVNVTQPKRHRSSSASSSLPKTPVDRAHTGHSPRFSVLKLHKDVEPPQLPSAAATVPGWLENIFDSLDSTHPLATVPLSRPLSYPDSSLHPMHNPPALSDEHPFSFKSPDLPIILTIPALCSPKYVSAIPFSTAGPCSTITAEPIAPHVLASPPHTPPLIQSPYRAPLSPVALLPFSISGASEEPFAASTPEEYDFDSFEDDPTTYISGKVYFDSPAEDPVLSDPPEHGYDLENIDFHWSPFVQNAPVTSNSDDPAYETRIETFPESEGDDLRSSVGDVTAANPEISSGLPLPAINRFPPPASRPEKYSTPATKASDIAENWYWKRDVRRAYPRLSVVTQSELSTLLIEHSAAQAVTAPTEAGKDVAAESPTAVDLSVALTSIAEKRQLYSATNLPPSFPIPRARWIPTLAPPPPHDPSIEFPMSLYK
ncbi:RRM domain-containing protein [Mycena kentingensis (nom. inval.)]|nr:RRM domain-containing protein [Mycena kentingensis (nom. inval.)]